MSIKNTNNLNRSDEQLLEAIQHGQMQALDGFYSEHRRAFLRWAEKTFGISNEEAVDVYQDAIVVVFEKASSGRLVVLESSLKTYLFAVGKNLILKLLRKREITQAALSSKESSLSDESEEIKELRIEKVRSIIANLPDPCKTVLQLYYYQQLPMRVIAQQMGYKSEDVAKVQKNRCMKSLKNSVLLLLSRSE